MSYATGSAVEWSVEFAMVKTWSSDNPKAALMDRKRAVLLKAALDAFLEQGYAQASVNHIAADAGVSIKTLYRHFEGKDELFNAVIQAACSGAESGEPQPLPRWYDMAPAKALPIAGSDYLRHAFSQEQLGLYRVVARDAHRFPEIGRRYWERVIGGRDAVFAGYLHLWAKREQWVVRDKVSASRAFAGLLLAGLFDRALLGVAPPSDTEIVAHAKNAAKRILQLLRDNQF